MCLFPNAHACSADLVLLVIGFKSAPDICHPGLVPNLSNLSSYGFSIFRTSSRMGLSEGGAAGHSPLLVVRVAVAVVLGVCAVAFDAAGAFLNAGPRAAPVVVLLVGSANPPGVRTSICEKAARHVELGLGTSPCDVARTHLQRGRRCPLTDPTSRTPLESTCISITGIFNKTQRGGMVSSSVPTRT